MDYDIARPGHSGNINKRTEKYGLGTGEIVVVCIQFVPALAFIIVSLVFKTWIPAIPGIIAVIICFCHLALEIKEAIAAKQGG